MVRRKTGTPCPTARKYPTERPGAGNSGTGDRGSRHTARGSGGDEEAQTPAEAETSAPAESVSAEAPQESASEPVHNNMSETTTAPGTEPPKEFLNSEVKLTENPEKPRKYYTGAHLAICLAAAGIMAAAAGIFAGLYFSVII